MDFDLTDEQEAIRRLARDFADEEVRPVAEELDREKRFPYEIVAKAGELGLMGIAYPEEYGGGGADTLSYALAIEELARVDSSVAITIAANSSLGTLADLRVWQRRAKARLAARAAERHRAWLLRADRAGGGLRRREHAHARAKLDEDAGEWVIDGAKQFITMRVPTSRRS